MRKILLILTVVVFTTIAVNAQDYKTGIGLRAGWANGLTVKHFVNKKAAFEGLLSTRWRGFDVTGLYEIHNNAFDADGLYWYYGFGAHLGFWNGSDTPWGRYGNAYTVIGVDGILGIEYDFKEIPFNIGLDWKPAFNVSGYTGFWGDGGALSLRYIF